MYGAKKKLLSASSGATVIPLRRRPRNQPLRFFRTVIRALFCRTNKQPTTHKSPKSPECKQRITVQRKRSALRAHIASNASRRHHKRKVEERQNGGGKYDRKIKCQKPSQLKCGPFPHPIYSYNHHTFCIFEQYTVPPSTGVLKCCRKEDVSQAGRFLQLVCACVEIRVWTPVIE